MPCECPMCQLEQSLRAKAGLNAAPSNGSTFSTLITIQGANSPFQLSGIYVASILVNGPDKDDVVATLLKVLADDSKFGFSVGNVEKSSHDAIEGEVIYVIFDLKGHDATAFEHTLRGFMVKVLDQLDPSVNVNMGLYPIEAVRMASKRRLTVAPCRYVFSRLHADDAIEALMGELGVQGANLGKEAVPAVN